jgi:ABC-type glycerol-3-phosphate transport system substrate-binding protein
MNEFTRRSLLQGGTALAAAGALTGPALLDFAKAWAQEAPWKPEAGAKLTVMRWKRFVPSEDEAFNATVATFQKATGVEMNVFSEAFEDLQPKASVAANVGSGPRRGLGPAHAAAAVPDQGHQDERRCRLSRQEVRRLERCGCQDLQAGQ